MCIFDKNLMYQHVPGQDSSPQLRGPDNTASGPTARLAMSLNFPAKLPPHVEHEVEVGQSTHFKTMTSLGMKRGEQSGSLARMRAYASSVCRETTWFWHKTLLSTVQVSAHHFPVCCTHPVQQL